MKGVMGQRIKATMFWGFATETCYLKLRLKESKIGSSQFGMGFHLTLFEHSYFSHLI